MKKSIKKIVTVLLVAALAVPMSVFALTGGFDVPNVPVNVDGGQGLVAHSSVLETYGPFNLVIQNLEGVSSMNVAVRVDGSVIAYAMNLSDDGIGLLFDTSEEQIGSTLEVIVSTNGGTVGSAVIEIFTISPITPEVPVITIELTDFERAVEDALSEMSQVPEGALFTAGTWRGFMRNYKGGIGPDGDEVIIDMTFSANEILDIVIVQHMDTGENPTEEDNIELVRRALEAGSHEFEPLPHLPVTSHNIAYAILWTARIASTGTSAVFSDVNAGPNSPYLYDINGIFSREVDGRNDRLSVFLNIEDGVIVEASILHRDTPYVVDDAVQTWANEIVSRQAITGVDAIAGATNTYVAIQEALSHLASDLGIELSVEEEEYEEAEVVVEEDEDYEEEEEEYYWW